MCRAPQVEAATATEGDSPKLSVQNQIAHFVVRQDLNETEKMVIVYAPFNIRVRQLANEEIIPLRPRSALAPVASGIAQYKAGEYAASVDHFNEAIEQLQQPGPLIHFADIYFGRSSNFLYL